MPTYRLLKWDKPLSSSPAQQISLPRSAKPSEMPTSG